MPRFGFDASVWEIFPYIISGAAIYIISEDMKLYVEKLNELLPEKTV